MPGLAGRAGGFRSRRRRNNNNNNKQRHLDCHWLPPRTWCYFTTLWHSISQAHPSQEMQLNKERQRKIRNTLHRSFPKENTPEFEL